MASPMRYSGLPPREAEEQARREAEERQTSFMRYGSGRTASTSPPASQQDLREPPPSTPAIRPRAQPAPAPAVQTPQTYGTMEEARSFKHLAKAPPRSKGYMFCDFCTFFLYLWLIPMIFFFFFHSVPVIVCSVSILAYMVGLAPLCGMRGNLLAAILTTSCLMACILSMHGYYMFVQPLHSLSAGRTYRDVSLLEPAAAFMDGAILEFKGNATVDVSRAAGYQSVENGGIKYCVAPIVDGDNDSDILEVHYWAVGLDCCGGQQGFTCGAATEASVHRGIVLHDPAHTDALYTSIGKYFVPAYRRVDLYQAAVDRAAVVYDVQVPGTIALLDWSSSTREEAIAVGWAWTLFAALVFTIFTIILATGLAFIFGVYRTSQQRDLGRGEGSEIPPSVWAFIEHITVPKTSGESTRKEISTFIGAYVVLVLSAILWTWLPCFSAGPALLALFIAGLCGGSVALVLTPHGALHGLHALFMAAVGTYFGWSNYVNNAQYHCSVSQRQHYTGVRPDAAAAEYRDAGVLYFEATASLGSHVLGYLHRGVTYCVAPVVAADESTPAKVDFWAVGTDCCSGRSKFTCFNSGDSNATSGVVLKNSSHKIPLVQQRTLQEEYFTAIEAASAAYNYNTSAEPILLHWGSDVDALQNEWLANSFGVILVVAGFGLIAVVVMASISIFCAAQHRWRQVRTHDWIQSKKDEEQSRQQEEDKRTKTVVPRRVLESINFREKEQ
mmetsp:Transcript_74544/g.139183  ORF Transcript_74544/g.139183 Transcript_74544/m.139183 type:complete len:726 (-) Transcript_74544:70-2247(-)